MSKPLVALASCAMTAVVAMASWLGWDRGFSEGAREATDRIFPESQLSSEVVQLRAQLEEQRRAEDRVSGTLLAAFGAVATVLAVVNIGVVLAAQQNYERDKEAMQIILLREAEDFVKKGQANWSTELARKEQELRGQIQQSADQLKSRLAGILERVDQLSSSHRVTSYIASGLFAQSLMDEATKDEANGDYLSAAEKFASSASVRASNGEKYWARSLIDSVIRNLNKITPAGDISYMRLDPIVTHLNTVEYTSPRDEETSRVVNRARELLESLRALHPES
jgi:hypothetical protein